MKPKDLRGKIGYKPNPEVKDKWHREILDELLDRIEALEGCCENEPKKELVAETFKSEDHKDTLY